MKDLCSECPHGSNAHSEIGEGCDECSCMLSKREVVDGRRDDGVDNTIQSMVWEDAVANGEPWALGDTP